MLARGWCVPSLRGLAAIGREALLTSTCFQIHYHILQHMIMGMNTVFTFGSVDEILAIPADNVQGYLVYGGDTYGNETHEPSYVHQFG